MFIDYVTTAAIAYELRSLLLGARVQDVLQCDRRGLALELYAGARHYLTVSADPEHEGLMLSESRARRGEGATTPLALAARKHLHGARLLGVEQPPYERILRMPFQGADRVELVVELMGRLANVILVGTDGVVLACARTVTGRMTRARTVIAGRPYEPPPPPAKAAPDTINAAKLALWLQEDPRAPAWQVLVRNLLGVSPLVGNEAVFRAAGASDARAGDVAAETLTAALRSITDLPRTNEWAPCIVRQGDEVVAYAPFELTHRGESAGDLGEVVEPRPDVLACVEQFISSRAGRDPYRDARAAVAAVIDEVRSATERRLAALRRERVDDAEVQRLRLSGDLVLTYQMSIALGQTSFTPPPESGWEGKIPLDSQLSAVENAQALYRSYQRKRDAAANAPARIAAADAQWATLDQLATDLALAEDRKAIDGVRQALAEGGFVTSNKPGARTPDLGRPLQLQSSDGLTILVGRNSRQNELVTFDRAKRGDLWLHARDVPGSHVVVKSAGGPVPERTEREAASLAAWYSKLRADARVVVAITDVRHVKRMRGAGVGMVVYDHDRTVDVAPASPEVLGLA